MRILNIRSYNPETNKLNKRVNFTGIRAGRNTTKALLFTALASLQGCASESNIINLTATPAKTSATSMVVKSLDNIQIAKSNLDLLMATNYLTKSPKTKLNPASYFKEDCITLDTSNFITKDYNYRNIEKLFGLQEGSLAPSNGIGSKKANDLSLSSSKDRKYLDLYTRYFPDKIRMWLYNEQFRKQWPKY